MTIRNSLKRALLAPLSTFSGPVGKGRVALTFDDGPDPQYTRGVVEVLRSFDAKATFFLVGEKVRRYPELTALLRSEGHELASHSMTHAEVRDLSYTAMNIEFGDMYSLRHSDGTAVFCSRFLRPPKGAVTPSLVFYCLVNRIRMIFWNCDPEDYAAQCADEINGYFSKKPICDGDIVLMHDCTPFVALALPAILFDLRARGLEPVTLSELI